MKLYLAASYTRKDEILQIADNLERRGHAITSTWVRERADPFISVSHVSPEENAQMAQRCFNEIDAADVLIAFCEAENTRLTRGGRHVEVGYAIATGKLVIAVDHHENMFYYHPRVTFAPSFEDVPWILLALAPALLQ